MRIQRLARLLALCLAVPLFALAPAACTSTGGPPLISQTLDEKALYVVELAYAGGLASVEAAVDAGALTGDTAAEAGAILDDVNSAVVLARRAYAAGETLQSIQAINRAYAALAELRAIVPPALFPR